MNRELLAVALKIVHVAWLSVLLGVGLELLTLVLVVVTGGKTDALGVAVGVLCKVSWSVVVCAALAVASAIPRVSVPAAGLTGLLVAPTTTVAVRVLQKVLLELLAGASITLPWLLVGATAVVKGAEYLFLGLVLAWLGNRNAGFLAALAAGLGTGVVFGGAVTLLVVFLSAPALSAVLAALANEVLFPVGCAVVLYGAERLARLVVPAEP